MRVCVCVRVSVCLSVCVHSQVLEIVHADADNVGERDIYIYIYTYRYYKDIYFVYACVYVCLYVCPYVCLCVHSQVLEIVHADAVNVGERDIYIHIYTYIDII